MDYNADGIDDHRTQEENPNSDRDKHQYNQGEQKTRSVPRYSKMKGDLVSSPFFQGDDRPNHRAEGGEMKLENNDYPSHQMHSAATADRREDIKSDYQRNRYAPIGQSVEGPLR